MDRWLEMLLLLRQELGLALILFILLFIKVGFGDWKNENTLSLVNLLLLVNLVLGFFMNSAGTEFSDMFRTDRLIVFEKNLLNLGTLIISLQSYDWLKTHKHILEFYIMLISTLIGLFFMISSANLLMFYLGLELSTIPLAAISNFDLEKRRSSEAAMKFIMSSAFSSGLLLLGISLVYGMTGALGYSELGLRVNTHPLFLFAFILLLSGFAFKISMVPFHLWTADVYEGSPVAVTSYLSVISKGAIFFVLIQVLYTVFKPLSIDWYRMIFMLSALTMLVGNLFAIRQENLKRLLAFSSIAQVGFILVGVSGSSRAGATSVIYFILIYILSNLGAFGVVSLISSRTGKESISDYKGLYSTNPLLSWVLAISLFSLAGIPPTAGFFGKFFLLMAGAGKGNYSLILFAAANMVLSLYYYLRVVKALFMDHNENPLEKLAISPWPKIGMLICLAGILGIGPLGWIFDYIYSLSKSF
jgi:NADH-quinone oxidoreductase subunit N